MNVPRSECRRCTVYDHDRDYYEAKLRAAHIELARPVNEREQRAYELVAMGPVRLARYALRLEERLEGEARYWDGVGYRFTAWSIRALLAKRGALDE